MEKVLLPVGLGCWEWKGNHNQRGYAKFGIGRIGYFAHRISWWMHKGKIPAGLYVLHHCDNPGCVNPDHLFLGTQKDNIADCISKGRACCGENGSSKLTESAVRQLVQLHADGVPQNVLALRFKISPSTINNIVHKKTWKHLWRKLTP